MNVLMIAFVKLVWKHIEMALKLFIRIFKLYRLFAKYIPDSFSFSIRFFISLIFLTSKLSFCDLSVKKSRPPKQQQQIVTNKTRSRDPRTARCELVHHFFSWVHQLASSDSRIPDQEDSKPSSKNGIVRSIIWAIKDFLVRFKNSISYGILR